MFSKDYSLHKSRKILHQYFALFQRKKASLTSYQAQSLEHDLKELDGAVLAKNRVKASETAKRIVSFCKDEGIKNGKDRTKEVVGALAFALLVAFVIRQFWFELYEVPTGSMRPTILELDRLAVSKTTFGLSIPFKKELLFFKPEFLPRGKIIVFTTEDMDLADPDMLYFGFIPGKKRYVKRCLALPGDSVYFYGGDLYIIDAQGQPHVISSLPEYIQGSGIKTLDHVPFISFEGKVELEGSSLNGFFPSVIFKQMNQPVARLSSHPNKELVGEFFDGQSWKPEDLSALKTPHDAPAALSDLWGIGHFAMARLLTPAEVKKFYQITTPEQASLILELQHTPSVTLPKPMIRRGEGDKIYPMLCPYVALLPLGEEEIKTLQSHLTTTRFCVKEGRAFPYQKGRSRSQPLEFDIKLPKIANGCYETYDGQGYDIWTGGFRSKLDEDAPLLSYDVKLIQSLFNAGIGWNRVFEPMGIYQPYRPHRYAYFKEGDLYVMGQLLLKKDAPLLKEFVRHEKEKQDSSTQARPYIAFMDRGAPVKEDGSLDREKIQRLGLKIPDEHVLGLGDNYAMSADSRDFGFIPIRNLRGSPSFNFWPISERLGPLPQPSSPWLTLPNLLIWSLVAIISFLSWLYYHNKHKRSVFKNK